jgi:tetratricopeptide (TPR) repeat protein
VYHGTCRRSKEKSVFVVREKPLTIGSLADVLTGQRDPAREGAMAESAPASPSVDALCLQAQQCLTSDDAAGALAAASEAIQRDPRHTLAYRLRAQAREGLGDLDGALDDLDVVIQAETPAVPDHYLERGRLLLRLGRLDEAIDCLREGVQLDLPGQLDTLREALLDALREAGDEVAALTLEADGIRDRLQARLGQAIHGDLRELHGDLDQVWADYDTAGPEDDLAAAYYRRGLVRHLDGNPEGALQDYTSALRADRNHAPSYRGRGTLARQRGEFEPALVDFDQALLLRPRLALALYQRGNTRQARGDLITALADYNRALDLEPGMACARLGRGSVHEHRSNLAAALADYEEVLALDSEDPVAYAARGRVRRALGQLDQAQADFDEVLRRDPGCTDAYLANRAIRIIQEGAPLARALPWVLGGSLGGLVLGAGLGWFALLLGEWLRPAEGGFPWLGVLPAPEAGWGKRLVGWLLWLLAAVIGLPLFVRLGPVADAPSVARLLCADYLPALGCLYQGALLFWLLTPVGVEVLPNLLVVVVLYLAFGWMLGVLWERDCKVEGRGWLSILALIWFIAALGRGTPGFLLALFHAGLLGSLIVGGAGWLLGGVLGALAGWRAPNRCARSLLGFQLRQEPGNASGSSNGSDRNTRATRLWARQAGGLVVGGTGLVTGFLASALALGPPGDDSWLAGGVVAWLLAWLYGRRLVLTPRATTSAGATWQWNHLGNAGLLLAAGSGAGVGFLAWHAGLSPGGTLWWGLTGAVTGLIGGLRLWWMLDR